MQPCHPPVWKNIVVRKGLTPLWPAFMLQHTRSVSLMYVQQGTEIHIQTCMQSTQIQVFAYSCMLLWKELCENAQHQVALPPHYQLWQNLWMLHLFFFSKKIISLSPTDVVCSQVMTQSSISIWHFARTQHAPCNYNLLQRCDSVKDSIHPFILAKSIHSPPLASSPFHLPNPPPSSSSSFPTNPQACLDERLSGETSANGV